MTSPPFIEYLTEMINWQRLHNREVHPEWDHQNYPFYRAIWTECAELLDHVGWKWWKHQEPDLDQVKLEIVDIWHFGLSMLIIEERPVRDVASIMTNSEKPRATDGKNVHSAVETMAAAALQRRFDLHAFMELMNVLNFSLRELYGIYKGKNILNRFRQAHGYKQGTYQKNWSGYEDNIHLAKIVTELDPFSSGFPNELYRALEHRYPSN